MYADDVEVKKLILEEGHKSRLSLHPGMTKMYQDLKENFWWQGMKKDVACNILREYYLKINNKRK